MPFNLAFAHPWDVSIAEAKQLQFELAQHVILDDQFTPPQHVAGVDVGFEQKGKITRAAIVVLRYPELTLVDKSLARCKTVFPYVPGYLSFRELPSVLQALDQLHTIPDIFLCDGQGIAHPRRFGIASHLGVLTDIPSIGVAKSRLIGTYQEPGTHKGDLMGIGATGKEVKINGIVLSRFEKGKIVEEWEVLDQLGMFQQLGVVSLPT